MQFLSVIQRYIRQQQGQKTVTNHTLHSGALLLGTVTLLAAPAQARIQTSLQSDTAIVQPLLTQTAPTIAGSLANGIYLFGEQPLPDQLQTAYMIFEARAGQVVGAFYSPHSSFDCFRGNVQNTQLSLVITETYSQEDYAYNLNLEDTAIAGAGGNQFAIEGFHQLDAVSENDLRMLNTCQASYNETI
ncbi:hypothetical protein [Leptothoe sp. PORK10 BA2]|uniref:hypothetical protein n=1 Tax=Leptothoe sp. PORK10 BA2 TaxID=3110254 RepID=UPI002B1FEF63|nr:hypothetical protein [Leptothoe sp. PORK10 BA2]MEA5465090.1 hypothetical protein [Leptothoe sp. PORK10 BA2]